MNAYTPRTGAKCSCKRGVQRDNCPTCEGSGLVIDFQAIHARREAAKVTIGDVLVCKGEPENGNPYGKSLMGDERVRALTLLWEGGDTSEFTFWHGPMSGGCRRIEREGINWETSGIPRRANR